MVHLGRMVLLASLICVLALTCLGQRSKRVRPKKEEVKAPVVRTELVFTPEESRKVGLAKVSYSSSRDETSAFFDLPVMVPLARPTPEEPFDVFNLQVQFNNAGRKLVKPDSVIIGLLAYNEKPVFKSARAFKLKADGREYTLSKMRKKSDVYARGPEQTIDGEVGFADFEQIANSRQVEVHVGPHVFSLEDRHIQAMRDMIKAITAP